MGPAATQSRASCVVRRLGVIRCLLVAVLALALAACDLFHSDFAIAVGNRTANAVSVFVDGRRIGDVGSNMTGTFAIEESLTGSVGSPAASTPVAQVTFSARDITTGALSAGVAATLVKDVTTYVDVAPCVSGGGIVPPCVSVSSTSTGLPIGSPVQACSFALSASNQTFNTTGGTGSVTVNTSSGCSWSATSSASWVVVVSGGSATGTGVVTFEVAPNTTGQARTASLSVGGQTLTISQTA